jgi:hypothetical protein
MTSAEQSAEPKELELSFGMDFRALRINVLTTTIMPGDQWGVLTLPWLALVLTLGVHGVGCRPLDLMSFIT